MSEEQRQRVLIGVLIVGVIGAGIYLYTNLGTMPAAPPTPAAPAAAGAPGAASTAGIATDDIDVNELIMAVGNVNFDYRSDRLARNPMTPLILQRGSNIDDTESNIPIQIQQRARAMLLTAILYNPTKPLAVLDNIVVEEGHVFLPEEDGGITVQKIEPQRVTLEVQEERIVLDMEEQ